MAQGRGTLYKSRTAGAAAVSLPRSFSRTYSRRGCHAQLARCCGGPVVLVPPAGGVRLRPLVSCGALRQNLLKAVNVLETVLGALGQAAENHALEVGRHVGTMLGRRDHVVSDMSDDHFHWISAVKGRTTCEKGVGKRAHGVDVAAGVEVVKAAGLFGGHEQRCAGDAAVLS